MRHYFLPQAAVVDEIKYLKAKHRWEHWLPHCGVSWAPCPRELRVGLQAQLLRWVLQMGVHPTISQPSHKGMRLKRSPKTGELPCQNGICSQSLKVPGQGAPHAGFRKKKGLWGPGSGRGSQGCRDRGKRRALRLRSSFPS